MSIGVITSRPISSARIVWLIARLSLRRQMNMWKSAGFGRKKGNAPALGGEPRRSGTPTKSRGLSFFSVIILLAMAFNAFFISSSGLLRLSRMSRSVSLSSDKIPVSSYTESALIEAENELQRVRELPDPAQRDKYVGMWNRHLDDLFLRELRTEGLSDEDENDRLQQMRDVFHRKGAAGFTDQSRNTSWVSAETWPRSAQPSWIFFHCLGFIVLLWMTFMVCGSLGLTANNLGEVEWNLEWLYGFPAPARALFAGKLFAYSFFNPLVWVFFFPLVILIYIAAGHGFGAIFLGLAVLLYLSILAGALCTVLQLALRKYLSLSQLKNVQALFTIIGTISLLLVYAAFISKSFGDFLITRATTMPEGFAWNPFSLPLFFGLPSAASAQTRIVAAVLMASVAFAFCSVSLLGSEWLTRDGLVEAGGPYQAIRRSSGTHPRYMWLCGIAAQEILLLGRDRNFLIQVLVIPLLVPAFYLLMYSGMLSAVSGNFRHAAVLAFGIGAYSYLSSAMPLLGREDKTLWQFLTFPQSLASILLKKTMVWAVLGLLYGGATLLLMARVSPRLHAGSLGEALLALYGIALYAFIAAGIGILATNVLETQPRSRFRTDMVYLYMILAAMFANAIYSPSLWAKLSQLVLSTLLAFALWQKVSDATPYLLDPVARPPRSLSLADGLIAALAFFVAQGLMFLLIHGSSNASMPTQISLAYVSAGFIVAGFAFYVLWRQNVPDLWEKIGVRRRSNKPESRAELPPPLFK